MNEDGTILAVTSHRLGSVLDADATTGDPTITVKDGADFDETGGQLTLDDGVTILDYLSADLDTGVITLSGTLPADADEGDRVDAWDAGTASVGVETRALVNLPGDYGNDDALDAIVSQSLAPLLEEGLRDPGTGENVRLELQGLDWVVTDVRGKRAQLRPTSLGDSSVRTSDNENTAAGVGALENNVENAGNSNTAFGTYAGRANTTGDNNTFVGAEAGYSNEIGFSNTAVGDGALIANVDGDFNTCVGAFAGSSLVGNRNTIIGEESALDLEDGDGNTVLGCNVGNGSSLVHGQYNTLLGANVTLAADVSGAVAIGVDSTETGAEATNDDDFILGTANHVVIVNGKLVIADSSGGGFHQIVCSAGGVLSTVAYP